MTSTTRNLVRNLVVALGVLGLLLTSSAILLADDNLATGRAGVAPLAAMLVVEKLDAPAYAFVGDVVTVAAKIKNIGMDTEEPEKVTLLIKANDGQFSDSVPVSLKAGEATTVTFDVVFLISGPFTLEIATSQSSQQSELFVFDD